MSFIIAVLGFGFLVFIHEFGHFLLARLTGMKVEKFSIGFGPALYQVTRGDTVYQLALLPFGGYVQIKGLSPEPGSGKSQPRRQAPTDLADLEREWSRADGAFSPIEDFDQAVEDAEHHPLDAETAEEREAREAEEREGSFVSKPLWARFLVVSAGPAFNALFTLIVFAAMFASQSAFSLQDLRLSSLVINETSGPAAEAGLRGGDVLVAVGDEPVDSFFTLRDKTIKSGGTPLRITVARPPSETDRHYATENLYERCLSQVSEKSAQASSEPCEKMKGITIYRGIAKEDWERVEITVTPENLAAQGESARYRIGVAPEWERFGGDGLWVSTMLGWQETVHLVKMMGRKIVRGIKGEESVEVASVVKITAISVDTVKMGNEWFINFLAFLSLNLAFLNLLPFPALDGGRLIFLGIEAISRRPVPPKVEMIVHGFGIMVLLILTLWVTTKDILSLL